MATDDEQGPKVARPQRFRTLQEQGSEPREVIPALPGGTHDKRFEPLKDARFDNGATTQQLEAVLPDDPEAVPTEEAVDEALLKPPMESALVPVLVALAMFVGLGAIVASFFH